MTQYIFRKLQRGGLSNTYGSNEELRCHARNSMALALLPPRHIMATFNLLLNETIHELDEEDTMKLRK